MRRIHFRKYAKFARRENKKVTHLIICGLRTFNYKKLPLFDKFLMTLEYLPKQCYHSKECVSVQCSEATRKKGVRKTDRKPPLRESILNNLNFTENGFHHSRLPANFFESFQKTSNYCIVVELNEN